MKPSQHEEPEPFPFDKNEPQPCDYQTIDGDIENPDNYINDFIQGEQDASD